MALPSSGQLSLKDILDEKQGSTTARTNISLRGLSVDGVADSSGGDISGTPNSAAPHEVSEFYGYSQDIWSTDIIYSPSTVFTQSHAVAFGGTAQAWPQVNVTFNSNGNHTVQWRDNTGSSTYGTYVPSPATTFTSSGSISTLQVRWKFVGYDRTINTYADSNDICSVNFHSANANVFTGANSTATNQSFTSSWQSCLPSALGGVNANSQSSYIRCLATGGSNESGDQIRFEIPANTSSKYVALQYRANNDDNQIIEFRNNVTTGVNIFADSYYEYQGFTCIMPNMLVMKKHINEFDNEERHLTRIGDIQVGDYILAQGDLNDTSVEPQWAEVTEARTHTREGYWNVQGLHITNDHPVWLTNESGSAWVKVEDINNPGSIERTYVEGTVDPVYLGTNPGHYYVYTNDHAWTVSGDYAPGSE